MNIPDSLKKIYDTYGKLWLKGFSKENGYFSDKSHVQISFKTRY